mmetsp:Transcript_34079/g.71714  ORF Transcript_34079/g.71714 Transcript_34079/m.71714 type:complete len:353 (+) Transcript_34079:241-1299(+)
MGGAHDKESEEEGGEGEEGRCRRRRSGWGGCGQGSAERSQRLQKGCQKGRSQGQKSRNESSCQRGWSATSQRSPRRRQSRCRCQKAVGSHARPNQIQAPTQPDFLQPQRLSGKPSGGGIGRGGNHQLHCRLRIGKRSHASRVRVGIAFWKWRGERRFGHGAVHRQATGRIILLGRIIGGRERHDGSVGGLCEFHFQIRLGAQGVGHSTYVRWHSCYGDVCYWAFVDVGGCGAICVPWIPIVGGGHCGDCGDPAVGMPHASLGQHGLCSSRREGGYPTGHGCFWERRGQVGEWRVHGGIGFGNELFGGSHSWLRHDSFPTRAEWLPACGARQGGLVEQLLRPSIQGTFDCEVR